MKVYLNSCRANFPFLFARHTFFVVKIDGRFERWELLWGNTKHEFKYGQIYKNFYPTFSGIEFFPGLNFSISSAEVLHEYYGVDAEKIYSEIKKSCDTYEKRYKYNIFNSNSNTYVKFILRNSGVNSKLPWNAFG